MPSFSRNARLAVAALCVASFLPSLASAAPLLPIASSAHPEVIQIQDGPNNPGAPRIWRGYKGAPGPRSGYRRHSDGWWYPLAAFAVGAVVGGAIANQPGANPPPSGPIGGPAPVAPMRGARFSPDHYAWCAKRYKSYRASDNTYIPRAGMRAVCVSPFR